MNKSILILLILLYKITFAQTGIITAKLDIREKADLAEINQAFIKNILNGECRVFKEKQFLIPDPREKITATIKKYSLAKRKIKAIYSIMQWDIKKQQGILLGYTPVYSIYSDTTFFYITADIHAKLDSNTSGFLRESCRKAILKSIN